MNINQINQQYFNLEDEEYNDAYLAAQKKVYADNALPAFHLNAGGNEGFSKGDASVEETLEVANRLNVKDVDPEDLGIFCPLWDVLNGYFEDEYRNELDRRGHYTRAGVQADTEAMTKGDVKLLDCNFPFPTECCVEVIRLDSYTFAYRTNTPAEDGEWQVGDEADIGAELRSLYADFTEANEPEIA